MELNREEMNKFADSVQPDDDEPEEPGAAAAARPAMRVHTTKSAKRKSSGPRTKLGAAQALMLLKADPDRDYEQRIGFEKGPGQIHIHQDSAGNIVDVQMFSKGLKLGQCSRANTEDCKALMDCISAEPRDIKHGGPWTVIDLDERASCAAMVCEHQTRLLQPELRPLEEPAAKRFRNINTTEGGSASE